MSILLNLKKFGQFYIIIVLFILLSATIGVCKDLQAKNATWQAYVEVQDNAIKQLNIANEHYKKQQILADKRADKIIKDSQKEIDKINKTKINSQCDNAIKDGIKLKQKYNL